MGYVTVLLSGVPKYVSLGDLGYYLECLFTTNSEIGPFEVRYLPQGNNKPVVALDFRSGFDAIAAQEQLDGYRYEMQDGTQYILHAKITKKEQYLRGDTSPERSWRQSRSSSTEKEPCSALALASMSDGAMFRANAILDAKYKLLKKQKLIVQTEMELIRERRKLRREYGHEELLESDDEPAEVSSKPRSRSASREPKSFSQELELYKIRQTAKRQKLKAIECRCKESASTSKLRSTQWDLDADQPRTSIQSHAEPDSRERSLRKYKSKSKVRSRAVRSRSQSRNPRKSCSRSRTSSSETDRSRSRTSSPETRRSKSRTSSPKIRRSKSRTSSLKTRRSRSRSPHNRSSSRDTESRERSCKRISKKIERSLSRISRSKRLRSPESCSRSRTPKSRNKSRLLAIMPKSPEKRETQISRSRIKPSEVDNSDIEMKITKKRTKRDDQSPKVKIKALRHSADIKTVTDLLKKDYTTSVTGTIIEKDYTNTNKHKKIKSIHPATDINRNKTGTLEDNKNMEIRDSIKNNEKQISKDTNKKTKEKKIKEDSAHRKRVKSDETKIRLICDDIMFLMKSLLLEISVKENIIISHNTTKLIAEKLNTVIHERVKVLYVEENLSVYNALDIYRKICTKEDDILLLKRMLKEVRTQETGTGKGNQNTLEKDANDNNLVKKSVQDMSNAKVDAVMKSGTEEYVHRNEGNKATEKREVIDIESCCPKESSIEASKINKTVPESPQFVLVVKRLIKQLKPVLKKCAQKGVYVNYFDMRQVLRIILKDMLKGEEYKPTKEIMAFFREKYPRDNDEEFVKKVAEDISMKKYDIEGMDKDSQDYGDVILIETNPEVVTIEDSDDDSDEIRKEIIAVINSLDERTGNQTTNEACNFLPEINILKEAVNRISDKKDETRNNTKIEKTNVTEEYSNIAPTEICNTSIKQETQQLDETGKSPAHICASSRNLEPKNADTTVNKEVQQTETELSHVNARESLKVTAITIVTSESELHSIAHGLENGNEAPKELKQEVDPELTEADIEKILSLDVNFHGYNTSEACEKEAPQVTAITIMTSESELLSLKIDPDGNRDKEVPEVKVENNDIDSETATQVQSNEYVENAALDINESVGNSTNAEVIRPEQDRRMIDNEEETIESICKFVTSLCDNL